jgi:MoxR-like ATPase
MEGLRLIGVHQVLVLDFNPELAAISAEDFVERFLVRASALVPVEEILVFPLPKAQKNRVRVSFGRYPDKASAVKAAEGLPAKYKESFGLEPRSFADLKADM